MRTKKNEIEIDSIGGLEPLTVAEEKALNDYFQKKKPIKKPVVKKKLNT